MATSLDPPHHRFRWLVELSYGSTPTVVRLTDQEADYTHASLGTFMGAPELGIEPAENTGTLDDRPWALLAPVSLHALFDNVSKGEPHAPVTARIFEETYEEDGVATLNTFLHFRGFLAKAIRNYNQQRDMVRLEFLSVKTKLNVPLGLAANPQCPWVFGDKNCKIDAVALEQTANLTAIDQNVVTLTGFASPSDRYWERGFVSFDGLSIGIRIWRQADPNTFHLNTRPPQAWLNQTVTLRPGCDKTIETCRARWANESEFGGFGYGIPSYQPLYETPSK